MSLAILRRKEVETVASFVKLLSTALESCSGMIGDRPYVVVSGLHFLTWRKVVPVVELFCIFTVPDGCDMPKNLTDDNARGFTHCRKTVSEFRKTAYELCSEELEKVLQRRMNALPSEICGTVVTETSASLMVLFHFKSCESTSIAVALTPIMAGSEFPEDPNHVLLVQGPRQLEWDDSDPGGNWCLIPPPFNHKGLAYSWELEHPSAYETVADFKKLVSPSLLLAYLADLRQWVRLRINSPQAAVCGSAKKVSSEEIFFTYKKNSSFVFRKVRLASCHAMSLSVLNTKEVDAIFAFMKLLNVSLESSNGMWCEQPYTMVAGLHYQTMNHVIPVVDLYYILNRPYQDGTYKVEPSKEDPGYFNYYRTTVKCGLKPSTFRKKAKCFVVGPVRNIIRYRSKDLPSEVYRMEMSETPTSLVVNFQFKGCVTPSVAIALTPAIAGTGHPDGTNKTLRGFFKKHGAKKGSPRSWWYLIPPPVTRRLNNLSWEIVIPSLSDLVKDSNGLVLASIFLQYIAEARQWSRLGLQSPHRAILSLILWMERDLIFLLSNAPLQEQMAVLIERLLEALTTGNLSDFAVPALNYLSGTTKVQRSRLAAELKKGFVSMTTIDHAFGTLVAGNTVAPTPKKSTNSLITVNAGQQTGCNACDSNVSLTDAEVELEDGSVLQKVAIANNYHVDELSKQNTNKLPERAAVVSAAASASLTKEALLARAMTFIMIVAMVVMIVSLSALLAACINDGEVLPSQYVAGGEESDDCSDEDDVHVRRHAR